MVANLEVSNRGTFRDIGIIQKSFKNIFTRPVNFLKGFAKNLICSVSSYVIEQVITHRRRGDSVEKIGNCLKTICSFFHVEPTLVCVGAIDLNIVSSFNFQLPITFSLLFTL